MPTFLLDSIRHSVSLSAPQKLECMRTPEREEKNENMMITSGDHIMAACTPINTGMKTASSPDHGRSKSIWHVHSEIMHSKNDGPHAMLALREQG